MVSIPPYEVEFKKIDPLLLEVEVRMFLPIVLHLSIMPGHPIGLMVGELTGKVGPGVGFTNGTNSALKVSITYVNGDEPMDIDLSPNRLEVVGFDLQGVGPFTATFSVVRKRRGRPLPTIIVHVRPPFFGPPRNN